MPECPVPRSSIARWFARFGVVGFMFFLVKGLLWLTVPAIVVALNR